jgi:HTH-type transcriptional regulator, osmoprotectant uptake regulator
MDAIDKLFVDFYCNVGKGVGADSLMSTIIAILYLEPKEMAMEQLAKKTGYSLASISNKARLLEGMGMIRKVKKPGTKKVYLYMEKDMGKIMKEHLIKKQEHLITYAKKSLPDIIKASKKSAKSDVQKEKVKILQGYYKHMLKFENLINSMLKELDKLEK